MNIFDSCKDYNRNLRKRVFRPNSSHINLIELKSFSITLVISKVICVLQCNFRYFYSYMDIYADNTLFSYDFTF